MSFELNSKVIKTSDFIDEGMRIVPESGIEDRYNTYIHDVCNKITSFKDNNADGVIRIATDEGIIYGIQEAKRLATTRFVFESVFMQALAYVAEFKMKFPQQIADLKFLVMPTEKDVRVVILKDIHPQLLNMFIEMYIPCKMSKLFTASTIYAKKSEAPDLEDVYWTIKQSVTNKVAVFPIGEGLDYKEVVEYILKNI